MSISEKSRVILQAIADGHTYEQILLEDSDWTYHDIFQAAAEALAAVAGTGGSKGYSVEEIRAEHPRAYGKWDVAQDEQLRRLHREGRTVAEIARIMQRQPGGIQSRLAKLNLVESTGDAQ